MKTLLGPYVLILPDDSDEQKTKGGIILPSTVKSVNNSHLKSGIVNRKGTGTPWNKMDDIHVKQRIYYKRNSGQPYEEDGAKYLMLSYNEIIAV